MDIAELIGPERVVLDLRVRDKAQLLEELAARAAALAGVDGATTLRALQAREELGSTGIGRGIALPHARVAGLAGLFGLFVRPARPVEFQAIDGVPAELVFLLLMPPDAEQAHLGALAAISRRIRIPAVAQELRRARSAAAAYRVLTGG